MAAMGAGTDDEWLETLKSMDEEIRKLSQGQTEVTGSEVKVTDDERDIVLYKILQGLDYTPMLGMCFMSGSESPWSRSKCDFCVKGQGQSW